MNVFRRTYLKLILISASFTIIFYFFCNLMIEYILNANMKLVCDVYYDQVSSKIRNDIILLQSANEYLTENEVIINYLKETKENKENLKEGRKEVLEEVNQIERILKTITFVETINIVDLENKSLFANGREKEGFDIQERPWYDDKLFTLDNNFSKIIDKHIDYSSGKTSISIVSLIYDSKNPQKEDKPIGAAIMDIYVENLLNYIDNSFYTGVLETEIYEKDIKVEDLDLDYDKYNIYINEEILNNGEYLVFKFDKSTLINASITMQSLDNMRYVLWFVGAAISVLLFISIRLSFNSALVSINKLKEILEKLNNKDYFIDNKNEFRQLEMLADTLNKSFDDKIQELIYFDELTGLPNRKMLENICEQLIEKKEKFALIFIDLNKFKYINDVFGHVVGDEYLKKFSSIIDEAVKEKGVFTRYSGDEFILVYENYRNNKEILKFYEENIVKKFVKPIVINSKLTTEIGFSSGCAIYPKDGETFEELIKKSDFMMYVNKKKTINRKIAFFDESMYEGLLYSERVKEELKYALDRSEFYLTYQPIVTQDNKVAKAEALLRWYNQNLGFIPPDKFIKHLEETRQIVAVGYWIIEEVCKNIESFKYDGKDVQISINISPLQIMLKDFIPTVKEIIRNYGVEYSQLCFEITENVLLENKDIVSDNIKMLQGLGIKIALDDFGTGYSSFNYLRNYKLDILKIDKIFLKDNEDLDYDIIDRIKQLAHILNMEVVMEGVETKEQFEEMKRIQIDYLQGYLFSKPLSLEEFKAFLENYNEK